MDRNSEHGTETRSRRTVQDEEIKAALAAGHSYAEAATLAGVSARTVRRRMEDEAFAGEVRRLRAERAAQLSSSLLELGATAITVLGELLGDSSSSVRLRAADAVLGHGQRYQREVDLVERIAAIERRFEAGAASMEGDDDEVA